jgi:hypothetical protein
MQVAESKRVMGVFAHSDDPEFSPAEHSPCGQQKGHKSLAPWQPLATKGTAIRSITMMSNRLPIPRYTEASRVIKFDR